MLDKKHLIKELEILQISKVQRDIEVHIMYGEEFNLLYFLAIPQDQ